MKFPSNKWIIGIVSIIAFTAMILPILFYVENFQDFNLSKNPADWGVLGDYFGGILNPIISLLTLIVTIIIAINISSIENRNHDESVHNPIKPFFIIKSLDFFSADVSKFDFSIGNNFYTYDPPTRPANLYENFKHPFFLQFENRGLGLATELQVTFKVDLDELKSCLEFENSELKITTSDIIYRGNSKCIIVNLKHTKLNSSIAIFESETRGLGVVNKDEKSEVKLPSMLMRVFEINNYLKTLRPSQDFPILTLEFIYKNIYGKLLKSHFEVRFLTLEDKTNYSVYRVLNRQLDN